MYAMLWMRLMMCEQRSFLAISEMKTKMFYKKCDMRIVRENARFQLKGKRKRKKEKERRKKSQAKQKIQRAAKKFRQGHSVEMEAQK
jgi:isocitrate/isopropylmalate dehydrogenase